jgi:hypothetical protein
MRSTSEIVWCLAPKGCVITRAVRSTVRPATRWICTPLVGTKAPHHVLVDSTRVANAASWVRSYDIRVMVFKKIHLTMADVS